MDNGNSGETYSVHEGFLDEELSRTPTTDHGNGHAAISVDYLISKYGVTEQDVAHIKETTFLYKRVFPRGHLIGVVGLPSAGKTTIMEYVCSKIEGTILYVNADIPATQLPEARRRAASGGYTLLNPDSKGHGLSMDDVVKDLTRMSISNLDLSDTVIIIDTLKKITDMISKGASSKIYKMLRALTGRGASVICLGHCNKYPDAQGWPIYEGTSDLRSDFDELVLLHPVKGNYGEVTTSLYWSEQGWPSGKSRAMVEEMTWLIDVEDNRTVTESDVWVDTVELGKEKREAMRTADVIRDIYHKLVNMGYMNQTQIKESLIGIHGERIIKRVLVNQIGRTWTVKKGDHNADIYSHIPSAELPKPKEAGWMKK